MDFFYVDIWVGRPRDVVITSMYPTRYYNESKQKSGDLSLPTLIE
jgi:hypothetical protein